MADMNSTEISESGKISPVGVDQSVGLVGRPKEGLPPTVNADNRLKIDSADKRRGGMARFIPAGILAILAGIGFGAAVNNMTDAEIEANTSAASSPTDIKGNDNIIPPGSIRPKVIVNTQSTAPLPDNNPKP